MYVDMASSLVAVLRSTPQHKSLPMWCVALKGHQLCHAHASCRPPHTLLQVQVTEWLDLAFNKEVEPKAVMLNIDCPGKLLDSRCIISSSRQLIAACLDVDTLCWYSSWKSVHRPPVFQRRTIVGPHCVESAPAAARSRLATRAHQSSLVHTQVASQAPQR